MNLFEFASIVLEAGSKGISPDAIPNLYKENPDLSNSVTGHSLLSAIEEYLVFNLNGDVIEEVGGWGGYEGGGDSMGLTLKWRDEYVALTGYYNSWDSSYYDTAVKVYPEEKTIQIFKNKEGRQVDRHYN